MKNKFLALIIVLAMLLTCLCVFASCQGGKAPEEDKTSDKTEEDTSADDQGGGEAEADTPEGDEKEDDEEEEEVIEADPYIEMITYNIAFYEATEANMTVYYEGQSISDYTIEKRAPRLAALVEHFAPDVLALQEVNRLWWPYIISNEDSIINTYGYSWAGNVSAFRNKNGAGSSDSDLYNLLLWDSEKFEEIDSGVFRLTQRLKGNANLDRLCTYAILKNRTTGVEILYASTHLCTRPDAATNELSISQATILTEKLVELSEGRMIVVGGDFNADTPTNTYKYMTETAGFLDARSKAKTRMTQNMCTARIWGKEQNWNNGRRTPIDHIFYLGSAATPEKWTVLTETYDKDNNVTTDMSMIGKNFDLSDHQGVYVRFREKTAK